MINTGFFGHAILLIMLAALLDIIANLLVVASRGFKRLWYGIAAYIFVGSAFYSLSIAVKSMDLAVAYAMWGGFGIIGTAMGGWLMFGQKPGSLAWFGMVILIIGMILLH